MSQIGILLTFSGKWEWQIHEPSQVGITPVEQFFHRCVFPDISFEMIDVADVSLIRAG
jgi:hypothetical protein